MSLPLSLFSPARECSSSSHRGAPSCAIDGATELAVPTTRARLDPPIAPPRRALSRARSLGRPRQGNGPDSTTAPWPELRQALGPRESPSSRHSFSSVASASCSLQRREFFAPLRSRYLCATELCRAPFPPLGTSSGVVS